MANSVALILESGQRKLKKANISQSTQAEEENRYMQSKSPSSKREVLSVEQLTSRLKNTLEKNYKGIWLEGEISNLTRHGSGHWYFTLKDEKSQIQGVMFRGQNAKVEFRAEAGMKVVVFGDVTVYPPRGNYQIKVSRMTPSGMGALQLAFEQLKRKLQKEGLFERAHKKELPFLPKRIAVVSSPTGAAIRDIVNVLTRRYPSIEMVLCPVRVQGSEAAGEVAQAIERLNQIPSFDLMIVGRGGGSLEDLWAFNEERVARAIFASSIPVISAVGHEVDFTIADFVADVRAPTPSAAAELAVPEKASLERELQNLRKRLASGLCSSLSRVKDSFRSGALRRLYQRPREILDLAAQRLDETSDRLLRAMKYDMQTRKQNTLTLLNKVAVLNPVDTLKRGFSVATVSESNSVVHSIEDVKRGDKIDVKVIDGRLRCVVESLTMEDLDGQGKIF